MNGGTDRWMSEWMEGWMSEWMEGWVNGWMMKRRVNGLRDRQMDE